MRLVLVGCGNMGHAMLKGWLAAGIVAPADILVVEPGEALRERAADLGVATAADAAPVAAFEPQLVVLAVKPQLMRDVTAAYRPLTATGSVFLSIAAGISSDALKDMLDGAPILRCMPNTPAAIGKGLMALYATGDVPVPMRDFVEQLLAANGVVVPIADEEQMHAVTALSGSGPAYLFHFIEALTAAGEKAGLPADAAATLARQTVYGAACLAFDSDETPGRLREQVTSPNGTTAAALSVLMGEDRLTRLVTEAVEAARRRSVELGN